MKQIKTYILSLSILAILILPACSKNDSLRGIDNFITEFSLSDQSGADYPGVIQGEVIRIQIPSPILDQPLTVHFALSQDATNSPDPATITEWHKEQTFTVSSRSGEKRTYKVNVVGLPSRHSGSITLASDEDVKAFAGKNINVIDGDLIIGNQECDCVVSNLTPLTSLTTVRGQLVIRAYDGADIDLPSLQEIGSLIVEGTPGNLKTIHLPGLKYLRENLTIKSGNIQSILLPEVVEIRDMTIFGKKVEELNIPNVHKAGNIHLKTPFLKEVTFRKLTALTALVMEGIDYDLLPEMDKSTLNSIELPQLTKVLKEIKIEKFPALTSIDLSKLQSLETIQLMDLPKLTQLKLDNLATVHDNFLYKGYSAFNDSFENQDFKSLSLPSLKTVNGEFNLNLLHGLNTLEVPMLSEVNTLEIHKSITKADFSSLTKVSKRITTEQWDPEMFPVLKDVNDFMFMGLVYDGTIDLSKIKVSNITLSSCNTLKTIITPAELDEFSLQYDYDSSNVKRITELQGLAKCKKLSYENINFDTEVQLPATLREVTQELIIHGKKITSISGPAVQSVGTLDANAPSLTFPVLTTVSNELNLTGDNIHEFNFPKLMNVKKLSIGGRGSWSPNTKITHLNGLNSLSDVGSISIQYCKNLVDYSALKKAFENGSITAKKWANKNIIGNAYNPTFEDLKAGNWVKP